MSAEQGLQKAIDELYTIFAPYTALSSRFGACNWLTEAAVSALKQKPLKELTASDLSDYANHPWYCGEENDFKHFLPRLAELFIAGKLDVTAEMFFLILPYKAWSERERNVVDSFLKKSWLALLGSYPFPFEPDEFLCGLAQIESDLSPFLDLWDENETLPSSRQLCLFIHHATYSGSWDYARNQKEQVIDWLLNPRIAERLKRASGAYFGQTVHLEFFEAINILMRWQDNFPSG
jgi:hypothetical protein